MHTGENEQGLRKILDLTRMIGIAVLLIHFYYYCYGAFQHWELHSEITDRLLQNIDDTGLFSNFHKSKLIALIILIISLFGARGRKDENSGFKTAIAYIVSLWIYVHLKFYNKIYRVIRRNYSSCFLNSSLLGKYSLYSFAKIVLLSSGKVNSTTVLFSCLQRMIPMVEFSSGSFILRS